MNGLDPDGRCVEKTEAAASYLGNKYANWWMGEMGRQWDESEALSDNLSQGNYSTALRQYGAHVGPSLIATIIPEGKPIGAAIEGAYYLAQKSAPIVEEAVSSTFAGYQGGPGAMWSGEVNGMPNPYEGVQEASQYLQEMGVSHDFRKQILESFDLNTIQLDKATLSEFGIRYFDSINAIAEGHYLFETFPASRMSLSLQPNWNKMIFLKQYQIRPGAMFLKGRASSQGPYLPGGQIQKYIINTTDLLP